MTDNILVYKFDELDQCSAEMSQAVQALDEIKKALKATVDSSESFWSGKAHDAFIERCNKMNDTVNKLFSDIDSTKKKLDKAIELEKQNESNIQNHVVGGIPASDIF